MHPLYRSSHVAVAVALLLPFAVLVVIPEEPALSEVEWGSASVCCSYIYFSRFQPKKRMSSPKIN
jgi:hypothetical protein